VALKRARTPSESSVKLRQRWRRIERPSWTAFQKTAMQRNL